MIALARQTEAHYTTLVRDHISGMQKNALVTRCKEEVGKRLRQKITVVELADELGVTRNYLSQLFMKEEGIPLMDYIMEQKILPKSFWAGIQKGYGHDTQTIP